VVRQFINRPKNLTQRQASFHGNQPQILFVQGLLVLLVIRIQGDAVHRADLNTLRLVEMPDTLRAEGWVDFVNVFPLGDCAVGALRFANIAVDAFVVNY
jgi:hypothetical protein